MSPAAPLEKILLYVDASDTSISAARYAIALTKAYGAQMHAVYVVNENMLGELLHAKIFVEDEETDLRRDLEEDGRRYLQFVERLAKAKDLEICTQLRRGNVHAEVAKEAASVGASVIIIGELEEPLSRKDSFYNEVEMILWTAKCPVLVVKGETEAEELYDSI